MSSPEGLSYRMRITLRRPIPVYALLALITLILLPLGLAYSQEISSLVLHKPSNIPITLVDTELRVESANFNYNPLANRWSSVTITVVNNGQSSLSGVIQILLYDAAGNQVAAGNVQTGSIQGGSSTTVTVNLSWSVGKSADDVASGNILVSQQ